MKRFTFPMGYRELKGERAKSGNGRKALPRQYLPDVGLGVEFAPVENVCRSAGFQLDTDDPTLEIIRILITNRSHPANFAGQEKLPGAIADIDPQIEQRAIGNSSIGAELDTAHRQVQCPTRDRSSHQIGICRTQHDLDEQTVVALEARVHALIVTAARCPAVPKVPKACPRSRQFDYVALTRHGVATPVCSVEDMYSQNRSEIRARINLNI